MISIKFMGDMFSVIGIETLADIEDFIVKQITLIINERYERSDIAQDLGKVIFVFMPYKSTRAQSKYQPNATHN